MSYLNTIMVAFSILTLTACGKEKNQGILYVATSAQYPPFEYSVQGEIKGFDIDLAQLIAKELGKKAVFQDMQFSSILPAVSSGQVDMAIATITITEERKKNLDFSAPYYFEGMAAVFKMNNPVKSASALHDKKLACQLGTTMEFWVKKHIPKAELIVMDNNNQAIEALKAGHIDSVIMDGAQAAIYSGKNPGLSFTFIAKAEDGYGIALPKNSVLTQEINQAIVKLQTNGEIQKLKSKWLENDEWKN